MFWHSHSVTYGWVCYNVGSIFEKPGKEIVVLFPGPHIIRIQNIHVVRRNFVDFRCEVYAKIAEIDCRTLF